MKKYGKILAIDFFEARIDNGGLMPIPEKYTIMSTAVASLRNITDKSHATLVLSSDKTCIVADFNGNVLTGKTFYGQIIVLIN